MAQRQLSNAAGAQRRLSSTVALAVLLSLLSACTAAAPASTDPATSPDGTAAPSSDSVKSPTPASASSRPRSDQTSAAGQAQLNRDLIDAAWKNNVKAARTLIEAGADVNAKDASEQSAFLIAASEGYLELLELTLDSGANVGSLDSYRGTALIRAAERGHADIVGRLLQTKIKVNHVNRLGWTALHEAIWLGKETTSYADTVRLLLAGRADVRIAARSDGRTPLVMARERGFGTVETTIRRALRPATRADNADLLAAAKSGDADGAALAIRDARSSKPEMTGAGRHCCSRGPTIDWPLPGYWCPWEPIPMPSTIVTTHRGWSLALREASPWRRSCWRPTRT